MEDKSFSEKVVATVAGGLLMTLFFSQGKWVEGAIALGAVLFLARYLETIVQILIAGFLIYVSLTLLRWGYEWLQQPQSLRLLDTSAQSKTIPLPREHLRGTLSLSEYFSAWPQGRTYLAGVPFEFDNSASFIQTQCASTPNDLPTQVFIPVNVDSPTRVYVLMNLSYGCTQWAPLGSKVGRIAFFFDGSNPIVVDLQTGYNIREWVIEADMSPQYCSIVKDITAPNVQQRVWEARRLDSSKLSVIDMFVFDVPSSYGSQRLTNIAIYDVSTSTTGSANPAIIIFGVTVFFE